MTDEVVEGYEYRELPPGTYSESERSLLRNHPETQELLDFLIRQHRHERRDWGRFLAGVVRQMTGSGSEDE